MTRCYALFFTIELFLQLLFPAFCVDVPKLAQSESDKYRIPEIHGVVNIEQTRPFRSAYLKLRFCAQSSGASVAEHPGKLGGPMYEEAVSAPIHFHIRWSGMDKLDWEPFVSREEAAKCAQELARPNESFMIEKFDNSCPQCEALRTQAFSGRAKVNRVLLALNDSPLTCPHIGKPKPK